METATIELYRIWGTDELEARLMYRGRVLKTVNKGELVVMEPTKRGLIAVCRAFAEARGFTHYKVKDLSI
jgi:hypothetical protein